MLAQAQVNLMWHITNREKFMLRHHNAFIIEYLCWFSNDSITQAYKNPLPIEHWK